MLKTHVINLKNKLQANQTKLLSYALVATSTIVVVQHSGIANLNEFLKENDLFDAYYNDNQED